MVKCDTLLDSWKWRILKVQFFQWIGRTKKIGATEKLSRVSSITNKGMGEFPILSNYSATRSILGTFIYNALFPFSVCFRSTSYFLFRSYNKLSVRECKFKKKNSCFEVIMMDNAKK